MSTDISVLINPISDDAPAGPDLSYEANRQAIEAAFERSISSDSQGDDEIDWRRTITLIEEEAEQTRDLWLAIYLMRAGAKAGRLETVEAGAHLLAGLCENLWSEVHPQIEDYGFQGRKGACEALTRLGEFLNPLRNVVLIEHPRLGRFRGGDFIRFSQNGEAEDGFGMFRALIQETPDEDLQLVIARLSGIEQAIRRADGIMTANADGDTSTNFQPTYDAIALLRRNVAAFLRLPTPEMADEAMPASAATPGTTDLPQASFNGGINSRGDVIKALDAIAAYYRNKEPGSPVPFALRRARDWVSLDFLQVLEDIAPNSIEEARRVLVNGRNDSSESWSSSSGED